MKLPSLVCPYNQGLLDQIKGHDIAIKVNHPSDISPAAAYVRSSGNSLINVIVEIEKPLNTIYFQEDWEGIPMALFAPEMGNFRDIFKQIHKIRDLKVHVYFPVENDENLASSHILASLGITCCLTFGEKKPNWDALSDLMTYAVLGSIPHAPIEPFHHIAYHYNPGNYVDWGSVYFDDPKEFLHMDSRGRVALSHHELLNGSFIAEDISILKDPFANTGYMEGINAWRQCFLSDHPCITCEGWKICLGKFTVNDKPIEGCSTFITEMLAVIEQYWAEREQGRL